MTRKPYQEVEVDGVKYWDYNFKINGIVYEISINQETGKLYITKDQDEY